MLFDGSSYYWEKWAYCKLLRAFGAALVSSLMWRAVRTTAFTPNSASSTAVVSSGVLRLHETRQVSSARCNRWPESDRLVHLTLCSSRAMKLYRHASSSSTPARAMSQLWEMKLHHCGDASTQHTRNTTHFQHVQHR
ncbi:hypothetical protein BDN71DRAFT_254236 [Pleurotus eryngii]|uniref:Uncharacterized protein n=1 Tax=Pleurotus eryngii TaxID=5323 RepID=A0A9P5ZK81_PLEER|nr:hypothetical protein BDN71DRAFT_254236 [Pleurotus eryngii]